MSRVLSSLSKVIPDSLKRSKIMPVSNHDQSAAAAAQSVFDPLTATVSDLHKLLESGIVKSEDLVDAYTSHIKRHNDYLKAVVVITPERKLAQQTLQADKERAEGKSKGLLHGIPILIKDNIAVSNDEYDMDTTAGSLALVGARSSVNSDVVKKLEAAGAIILGKTTLSELAFYKGIGLRCAWSALSGQGQSAYVRGGVDPDDTFAGHSNPGGSSSGSAIAVSAGFAPVSVGTETDGSIVMPGNRASLYSMKPTVGLCSAKGVIPVCKDFDTPGPFAKSPRDLAILLEVLADPKKEGTDYIAAANEDTWKGLRVGVLDPKTWQQSAKMIKPAPGAAEQMVMSIERAYAKIKPLAKSFRENIDVIPPSEIANVAGELFPALFTHAMQTEMDAYLKSLEQAQVRSVKELVEFNIKHAERELPHDNPNQDYLLKVLNSSLTSIEYQQKLEQVRKFGRDDGIDHVLHKYDIDVIIGPADSPITKMASAAGYPIATLPLGYLDFNGRAFGLVALVSGYQEELLLNVMGAWEATFPAREPPPMLRDHKNSVSHALPQPISISFSLIECVGIMLFMVLVLRLKPILFKRH